MVEMFKWFCFCELYKDIEIELFKYFYYSFDMWYKVKKLVVILVDIIKKLVC